MGLSTSLRESTAGERVGSTLNGKWRLGRLLGIGGMGTVYEARHRNGTRAALKLLHEDLVESREERARFLREGYIANRVEHPAVVRVLDDDISEATPYLVMELVEGESLDAIAGAPLGEPELLDVADQVLDALIVAHARGVVHRDIKPQNLLLDRARRIRILDFGIAHLVDDSITPIIKVAQVLGTLEYMAPELLAGENASPHSDLYALGAMLFVMSSKERLHLGSTIPESLHCLLRERPRSLSTVSRAIDGEIVSLVDRATRASGADPWTSAEDMQREVRRIRARLPACTWDLGRTERAEAPTRRLHTPTPGPPPKLPEPPRSGAHASIATMALLVAALAGSVVLTILAAIGTH